MYLLFSTDFYIFRNFVFFVFLVVQYRRSVIYKIKRLDTNTRDFGYTTYGVPFSRQAIMTKLYVTTGKVYANNMITSSSCSALGFNDKIQIPKIVFPVLLDNGQRISLQLSSALIQDRYTIFTPFCFLTSVAWTTATRREHVKLRIQEPMHGIINISSHTQMYWKPITT